MQEIITASENAHNSIFTDASVYLFYSSFCIHLLDTFVSVVPQSCIIL